MNTQVHFRSKVKREFIQQVIGILAKELKLDKRNFELDVCVRPGLAKNGGYNGAVQPHADGGYVMFVDSALTATKMVEVIAHEMVHVKQFVLGQLRIETDEYGFATYYWRGEKNTDKYFDRPWEIDAWKKERLLSIAVERKLCGNPKFEQA
jgi:hypothetical protein